MDPTQVQYAPLTHIPHGGGGAPGEVVSVLPFTGFDVIVMLAVVVLLVTAGLVLRRLTRHALSE